jgi:hypothetical protein
MGKPVFSDRDLVLHAGDLSKEVLDSMKADENGNLSSNGKA